MGIALYFILNYRNDENFWHMTRIHFFEMLVKNEHSYPFSKVIDR